MPQETRPQGSRVLFKHFFGCPERLRKKQEIQSNFVKELSQKVYSHKRKHFRVQMFELRRPAGPSRAKIFLPRTPRDSGVPLETIRLDGQEEKQSSRLRRDPQNRGRRIRSGQFGRTSREGNPLRPLRQLLSQVRWNLGAAQRLESFHRGQTRTAHEGQTLHDCV